MRITVNLSLFFHDHKSLAKIFINENIKTVKDAENRISEIFKIDNFYLKCENQYLPPSEDIHILNNDDIVWVLPKSECYKPDETNVVDDHVETEQTTERKKKKKKKHKEAIINDEETNLNKKRKRHGEKSKRDRDSSAERNVPSSEYTKDDGKSKRKKLKTKSKVHEEVLPNVVHEDSISKDSGRDSFDSSKSDEVESQSINVKSLVHSFEHKTDLKKCLEHSFTPIQKNTNIVKTIIISSNKSETLNSESTTRNKSKSNLEMPVTESVTPKPDSSADINDVAQTNTDIGKNDQQNNKETKFPAVEQCAFYTNNVRKRRRKRTNKKRISNEYKFDPDYLNEPEYTPVTAIPKLVLTKTAAGRHVRFKDSSEVIPSPEQITDSESVVSKENVEDHKENCIEETKKVFNVTEVINNKELTEEVILRQPDMKNIQPRLGDIIAFKILRISENYTPEVSTWIVGKVSDYDLEKLEITFDVMDGKEQCIQPQGKFSLDLEEENEPEEQTNKFHCAWSSVLDPRLLYP